MPPSADELLAAVTELPLTAGTKAMGRDDLAAPP